LAIKIQGEKLPISQLKCLTEIASALSNLSRQHTLRDSRSKCHMTE